MIIVINYGMGNLRSVEKALNKLGADFKISNDIEDIRNATHLILPGVGAFREGMKNLENLGLVEVLREEVLDKKKLILGICLGMQLFFDLGEEDGKTRGLGFVKGKVQRFDFKKSSGLKVPHIGWNEVFGNYFSSIKIFEGIEEKSNFYFVHSYHGFVNEEINCLFTDHGYDFVSILQKQNIFGTQFHPEKSQTNGLKLIKNFINLNNA